MYRLLSPIAIIAIIFLVNFMKTLDDNWSILYSKSVIQENLYFSFLCSIMALVAFYVLRNKKINLIVRIVITIVVTGIIFGIGFLIALGLYGIY